MAYTIAFDNTYPPGNTAASLISQTFRNKTTMIGERLMDLFGMPDYTSDPLKTTLVRLGCTGSGTGGQVCLTDDTGIYRWACGILHSAGAKAFVVYDNTVGIARLTVDATNGNVTVAQGLTVGQGLTVTTNLVVGGTSTFTGNITANGIGLGGNGVVATNYQILGNGNATFASVASNNGISAAGAITSSGGACTIGGSLSVVGALSSNSYVTAPFGAFGTTPANIGIVRIPNNNAITARNAANTGDVNIVYLSPSDNIFIGNAVVPIYISANTTVSGNLTSNAITCTTLTSSGNISVPHANSVSAGAFYVI